MGRRKLHKFKTEKEYNDYHYQNNKKKIAKYKKEKYEFDDEYREKALDRAERKRNELKQLKKKGKGKCQRKKK